MDLVQARKALRVLIVDDVDRERDMVAACLQTFQTIEVVQCSSVEEVEAMEQANVCDVCLLDARFGPRNTDRLLDLLDIAEQKWPYTIKIVVTGHSSKYIAGCGDRLHGIVYKSDLETNSETLIRVIEKAVRTSDYCKRPNRARVLDELTAWCRERHTKVVFETIGWIVESQGPHIEVEVHERSERGRGASKHLLMPRSIFAAAGVLAEDERFRYRVFLRDNQMTSEIIAVDSDGGGLGVDPVPHLDRMASEIASLDPEDDDQAARLSPELDRLLREVEEMQNRARRMREAEDEQ